MTTTKNRLDRLEQAAAPGKNEAPSLILMHCDEKSEERICGIESAGTRLPAVARLPGETIEAMKKRAEGLIVGPGPLIAFTQYDDMPHGS